MFHNEHHQAGATTKTVISQPSIDSSNKLIIFNLIFLSKSEIRNYMVGGKKTIVLFSGKTNYEIFAI